MNRPTAALCLAAFTSVGLALDMSYLFCPVQGEPAVLSVVEPPHAAEEKTGKDDLHRVREHPARQGGLTSPFLPEHPTRPQARAAKPAPAQTPKPEMQRQTASPAKEPELRLVGVVSSESGRRAIFSVGARQILLAPGETKSGVTLLSLTENAAIVSTSAGERQLSISQPLSSGLAE